MRIGRNNRDGTVAVLFSMLCLALGGAKAHADTSCDSQARTFTFTPPSDRDPQAAMTCQWKDGTTILVHYRTDVNEMSSETEVSVWVNEAKWVSHATTGEYERYGESDFKITSSITINAKGMTLCKTPMHEEAGSEDSAGPEVCKFQPKESLPHKRDSREFPEHGKEIPQPPTAEVVASDDDELCAGILREIEGADWGKSYFSGGARLKELVPKDSGPVSTAHDLNPDPPKWDIDNTGQPLLVLHTDDAYYAYDNDAYAKLLTSERTEADIYRFATRVFPQSAGYCPPAIASPQDRSCPPENESINPVSYRGTHYLFVSTNDREVVVIKPTGTTDYARTCTLQRVEQSL